MSSAKWRPFCLGLNVLNGPHLFCDTVVGFLTQVAPEQSSIFCLLFQHAGIIYLWIPRQRPVTQSSDVFFDLRLNKRLSNQWWGWWFETPWGPLWRHCNVPPNCKKNPGSGWQSFYSTTVWKTVVCFISYGSLKCPLNPLIRYFSLWRIYEPQKHDYITFSVGRVENEQIKLNTLSTGKCFLLLFRRFMRELWLALWLFPQSCHLRTCVNCVFMACHKMHVNVLPITSIRKNKGEQQLNYCKSWAFKK